MTCAKCSREYKPGEEPDPCLGTIPGVVGACCGHGNRSKAYVQFEDGMTFRGFKVEFYGQSRERRVAH